MLRRMTAFTGAFMLATSVLVVGLTTTARADNECSWSAPEDECVGEPQCKAAHGEQYFCAKTPPPNISCVCVTNGG